MSEGANGCRRQLPAWRRSGSQDKGTRFPGRNGAKPIGQRTSSSHWRSSIFPLHDCAATNKSLTNQKYLEIISVERKARPSHSAPSQETTRTQMSVNSLKTSSSAKSPDFAPNDSEAL